MLNTVGLKAAGIPESKNPLLQDLWAAVLEYNKGIGVGAAIAKFESMNGHASSRKATQLQDVMLKAGAYLTSKPPQQRRTNMSRWDVITSLAEDAGKEADKMGMKMVTSPADMRKVSGGRKGDPSVWLEVMDPMHRDQNYLSEIYEDWLVDAEAARQKSSFWGYKGAALKPDTKRHFEAERELSVFYDTMARSLAEFDVVGRLVEPHGDAVDTLSMHSEHTGKGWGIFVCDTKRRFFVNGHASEDEQEMIRHTTLAAGAAVLGAGEIVVEKGRIRALSNETGHYRLPYKTFLRFIINFPQIPGDAVIKVFAKEEDQKDVLYTTARHIRIGGGDVMKTTWKDKAWAEKELTLVNW